VEPGRRISAEVQGSQTRRDVLDDIENVVQPRNQKDAPDLPVDPAQLQLALVRDRDQLAQLEKLGNVRGVEVVHVREVQQHIKLAVVRALLDDRRQIVRILRIVP
jgi:hypothetical protein